MEGFTTCWLTDVYAGNTVEQMLKGKQFNRAVRGSMTCSGTACLISILISVKYLHDQEICFQAVDQRKNCQTSHHGMNKLRVIVATSRDASLVRLSPSEAALIQHSLRAFLHNPNLDCLACCKTPYSTTIRIQMTTRKGFATTGIL